MSPGAVAKIKISVIVAGVHPGQSPVPGHHGGAADAGDHGAGDSLGLRLRAGLRLGAQHRPRRVTPGQAEDLFTLTGANPN